MSTNRGTDARAGRLRQFRLLAFATGLLLWAGLGVAFGLLSRPRVAVDQGREPVRVGRAALQRLL